MSIKKLLLILGLMIVVIVGCVGQEEEEAADPIEEAETATAEPLPTDAPSPTEMAVMSETVDIKLFLYQPKMITVTVGTAVTWINHDDIQHSVTNGTPDNPGDEFDSDFFFLGESYSLTFSEPGTYQYFCKRHNHMQGLVEVVDGEE